MRALRPLSHTHTHIVYIYIRIHARVALHARGFRATRPKSALHTPPQTDGPQSPNSRCINKKIRITAAPSLFLPFVLSRSLALQGEKVCARPSSANKSRSARVPATQKIWWIRARLSTSFRPAATIRQPLLKVDAGHPLHLARFPRARARAMLLLLLLLLLYWDASLPLCSCLSARIPYTARLTCAISLIFISHGLSGA